MSPSPSYCYHAEVLSVTDGDTLKLRVDVGFEGDRRIAVRLAGVYAAERHEEMGALHTGHLRSLLPVGSKVVVMTQRNRGSDVTTFGRYVADVWCEDEHVNEEMRRLIGKAQGIGAAP